MSSSFKDRLKTFFRSHSVLPSRKAFKNSRRELLAQLDQMCQREKEQQLLSALQKHYRAPSLQKVSQIKREVMDQVHAESPSWMDSLVAMRWLFSKRLLASSFATVFLLGVVVNPLRQVYHVPLIPEAKAIYLECSEGDVSVNLQEVDCALPIEISPGDYIETGKLTGEKAVLKYKDGLSLTRIDSESIVQVQAADQLRLESGALWMSALNSVLQVSTQALTAKVQHGAMSVKVAQGARGKTELVGTVPLKVQISSQHPKGSEVKELTVLSEKITVHNNRNRVIHRPLDNLSELHKDEWVRENWDKDVEYVATLKEDLGQKQEQVAGSLTGPSDSLSKMASLVKGTLALSDEQREDIYLSYLNELFAESLLLSKNGDQATADAVFQSYQDKFTSLLKDASVTMAAGENGSVSAYEELFHEHSRIVSLYTSEDPEYAIQTAFLDFTLYLEPLFVRRNSPGAPSVASTKLVEAYKVASSGDIVRTKELLQSYGEALDKTADVALAAQAEEIQPPALVDTDDLEILTAIGEKSLALEGLVTELKQKKVSEVEKAASQLVDRKPRSAAVGTAYKENESVPVLSTIVGQATEEDKAL